MTLAAGDRKSTRLNSSHGYISYAVFCLKKKKKNTNRLIVLSHALVHSVDARATRSSSLATPSLAAIFSRLHDVPFIVFPFFFFNDTATTEIYTLSLHDALPICPQLHGGIDILDRGHPLGIDVH